MFQQTRKLKPNSFNVDEGAGKPSWLEGVGIAIIATLFPLFVFSTFLGGPRYFSMYLRIAQGMAVFGALFGLLCASGLTLKTKAVLLWGVFVTFMGLGLLTLFLLLRTSDGGGLLTLALIIYLGTLGGAFFVINLAMKFVLEMEASRRSKTIARATVILVCLTALQAARILPSGLYE